MLQTVSTLYSNKNDDANISTNDQLSTWSSSTNCQHFTLYDATGNQKNVLRQSRMDRAVASNSVSWATYFKKFKATRKSFVKTFFLATIAPLLMIMGLTYLCWESEETKEAEKFTLALDTSLTLLRIPVLLMSITFIFSFFMLILGIQLHQRLFLFACVGSLVVSLGLEIFAVSRIIIRSSTRHLKLFLQDQLISYRDREKSENSLIFINQIQKQFSCCGISKYQDWFVLNIFNESYLPKTCCHFYLPIDNRSRCYVTNNKSDPNFLALARKGCLNKLQNYLDTDDDLKWTYIGGGILIIFLTLFALLFYTIPRRCNSHLPFPGTVKTLKPEVWSLINKLVDEFIDKLFTESFSNNLKDYIKEQVGQCENMDHLSNLLITINDTLYYMKYPRPEHLAQFILTGTLHLVSKFERGMQKLQNKSTKENSQGKSDNGFVPKDTVPQNSVQDLHSTLSESESVAQAFEKNVPQKNLCTSAIMVPYELKRRMKNVENFLIAFQKYEMRMSKQNASYESLEIFPKKVDAVIPSSVSLVLPKNLTEFRRKCFGTPMHPHHIDHSIIPLVADNDDLTTEEENFIQRFPNSLSDQHQRSPE